LGLSPAVLLDDLFGSRWSEKERNNIDRGRREKEEKEEPAEGPEGPVVTAATGTLKKIKEEESEWMSQAAGNGPEAAKIEVAPSNDVGGSKSNSSIKEEELVGILHSPTFEDFVRRLRTVEKHWPAGFKTWFFNSISFC
jgi:hypothetical protein